MTWRSYVFLFLLGLAAALTAASFQDYPGYMDADYYFVGGLQLVEGKGFTEPFLWNYLDDPAGLPHPSHTYWLPLSSILAALSMFLTGQHTYAAARLIFILIAACIPPLTARLALDFTDRRALALTSGLLAVFSVYHVPFMPVTDNFAPFMLLGGLVFLLAKSNRWWAFLLMGLLSGLMNLARSDGLLWLALLGLLSLWRAANYVSRTTDYVLRITPYALRLMPHASRLTSYALLGYLLIMAPWYARNLSVFGSLMAPGGDRILWLTNYNDTFAFPAGQVNIQSWLAAGWSSAFKVRLWALGMNAQNVIGAQGGILLFPFILIGLWQARRDLRVRLAATGWLLLLAVMTLVFPLAGARGGFFHAGVAFQPLWWALAPLGLERIVAAIRARGFLDERAYGIFRVALVAVCALLTVVVLQKRIFQLGWQNEEELYGKVEQFLVEQGAQPQDIVIALNPPGYYLVSGRSALVQPPGGPETILAVAARYGASYCVLEPLGVLPEYRTLYEQTTPFPGFEYLGEVDDARIFALSPAR
ncbi:MAG: hypothetical protein Fur0043_16420 [Anaerolineales bacterium]